MSNNTKRGDIMLNDADSKRTMGNALKRKGISGYNDAVGGLGLPSKMPGYAYGISAERCALGSILRARPGSICAGCYAMKNNYRYPSVIKSHEKRYAALEDLVAWADNMTALLKQLATIVPDEERYFRFHDSGDLQGTEHLHAILRVAVRNPEWQFWLPTREYGIVREVKAQVPIPRNITIRLSAIWLDKAAPGNDGLPTSTVGYDEGYQCPASNQKNACGSCRACWSQQTANVNYKKH